MSQSTDPCENIYIEKEVTITIKCSVHCEFSPNTSEEDINQRLEELVREHFYNNEDDFMIEKIEM